MPVSLKADSRFPLQAFRITASIPADAPTGKVTGQLVYHKTAGLGFRKYVVSIPFSNALMVFIE